MLFQAVQQHGVINGVKFADKSSSQNRNLACVSCKNIINNAKKSCFSTVTSAVGRLKFVFEMVESEMICKLHQDNFVWDLG